MRFETDSAWKRNGSGIDQLAKELRLVLILQGVVKVVVPGIELDLEPDQHQSEADHCAEQRPALRALLRYPIGLGERPESL